MTVLGNIVAVTSIIAVVSLVQGLNSSVAGMIQSRFAPETFTVMRAGRPANEAEQLRNQSNPRISLQDADAVRNAGPRIALVMAQARAGAPVKFRGIQIDSVSLRGVSKEYVSLPTTQIERGRPITPGEFDAGRFVAILGYDTAERLFGALDPLEKTITIAGVHFRVVGVAPKQGAIFGQSQDQFAVIPLAALMRLFGTRLSLELVVQPHQRSGHRPCDDAGGGGRVKVGVVLSITGPASFLGDPEEKTLEMYVERINEEGGILGCEVEVEIRDDAFDMLETTYAFFKQHAPELYEHQRAGVLLKGIELELESGSPEGVLEEALHAFAELVEPSEGELVERPVDIDASDPPALLAAWLDELLFLADAEQLVPESAEVSVSGSRVTGLIRARRGEPRPLVKAVTLHRLRFGKRDGVWRGRVVLDV